MGIAAAVFKNDFSMVMKDTLKESMKNYTEADKMAWDNVQQKVSILNLERSALMDLSIQRRDDKINILSCHGENNGKPVTPIMMIGYMKRSSRANNQRAIKVISLLRIHYNVFSFIALLH